MINKIITLLFLSSITFSFSIELYDDADVVTETLTERIELDYDGGDGSSDSSTVELYVPMEESATPANQRGAFFKTVTSLPNESGDGVRIALTIEDIDTDHDYIILALEEDDDEYNYIAFQALTTDDNHNVYFNINWSTFCSNTAIYDCNQFDSSSTLKDSIQGYIFLANSLPSSSIDPLADAYKGGLYVNFNLSTDVTSSTTITSITSTRGDGSAYLDYSGSIAAEDEAYVDRMGAYVGANLVQVFNVAKESGSVQIDNLDNGTSYTFSLKYIDRYGFITAASPNAAAITPEALDVLLTETQCYLLTAGFGRDHYIIDYFRFIRDEYLMKFTVGQAFVIFYYYSAPKLVYLIRDSLILQSFIKSFSYVLFSVLKNIEIVLLLSFVTLFLFLGRKWQRRF